MAVLKSFELMGNKQSFANWISLISPCDTPFVSMIGKAKVDQTQYSWQTDALATPSASSILEGSDVDFPKRAVTGVETNFTQILRKVVTVSDTGEATDSWGRKSEMEYQLKKAVLEMKRDLEHMNLQNGKGNPGTPTLASKYSGFEGLVAPLHTPDPNTGAVVHLESFYFDNKGPWLTSKDLFSLTYQLYMSGSKANKIMYHPRHAVAFSKFVTADFPNTFRMFDNLGNTLNAFVDKVKCPLGRMYELIPNRHMPEDKIFIFNENDWTQTILRTPVVSKLGKQGSAERYLIEMEVGLRSTNPYAAGVLTLVEENLRVTFPTFQNDLTFGVNPTGMMVLEAQDLAGNMLPNKAVEVICDTPDIISFAPTVGVTNADGKFQFEVTALKVGRGEFRVSVDGMLSRKFYVAVHEPEFFANLSPDTLPVSATKKSDFQVFVNDSQGSPAGAGIDVSWSASPSNLIEFDAVSGVTDDVGIASTMVRGLKKGAGMITPFVGGFRGESIPFYVGQGGVMTFTIDPNPAQPGQEITMSGTMLDQKGEFLSDDTISFTFDPPLTGIPSTTTDATGNFEAKFTPLQNGDYEVVATSSGFGVSKQVDLVIETAIVTIEGDTSSAMHSSVDDYREFKVKAHIAGKPLVNHEVALSSSNNLVLGVDNHPTGFTDHNGEAVFTVRGVSGQASVTLSASVSHPVVGLMAIATETLTVRNPRVTSELNKISVPFDSDERAVLTIRVMDTTNKIPFSGKRVQFLCTPSGVDFEYVNGNNTTDSDGYVSAYVKPREIGVFSLSGRSGSVESTKRTLTVTDVPFRYSISGADRFLTAHIGQTSAVTCGVMELGIPAVWKTLRYSTHDMDMIDLVPRDGGSAGATGFNTVDINPKKVGKALIRVQADGASVYEEFTVEIKDPIVSLTCNPNPAEGTQDVSYILKVTDVHGAPAQGVDLELYHTAIFNNHVPRGKSDVNGELLHIRKIAKPGTYNMQTYLPYASNVRSPMTEMVIKDRPYVYSVLGNLTKATHGIDLTHEVQIVVRENNVLQSGVVIEHEGVDDEVSLSKDRYSTDASGSLKILVKPKKKCTTRIKFRAAGNSEWHHFDLVIADPEMRIVINPLRLQAGKDITFGAALIDANGTRVPGKTVKWSHPTQMLMNQDKIPNAVTDALGTTEYKSRAGAWGTHQVFWYVESPTVKSTTVNVTSHM